MSPGAGSVGAGRGGTPGHGLSFGGFYWEGGKKKKSQPESGGT